MVNNRSFQNTQERNMMGDISFYSEHMECFENTDAFLNAIKIKQRNWDDFIKKHIISPDMNPTIAQSWIRSKAFGIDPFHVHVHHLTQEELQERREKNAPLLQYAQPLMNKLADVASGNISLMSLHDSDGYMLELNDRQRPEVSWRDECFHPGVRWREEDVGTNGLGLVLIEKQPIQIIGPEHYNYNQRNICCCAAPIFDADETLVGVLNVCAQIDNFSPHLMMQVILSCYAISNQLKAYRQFEIDRAVLDIISECVIVLDQHMNIIRCSNYAANLFHTTPPALIGLHIQELIHIPELAQKIRSAEGICHVFHNCSSYFNGQHLSCEISATLIREDGCELGTVLIVRNSKAVAKNIANTIGNYARFTFEDITTVYPPLIELIGKMKANANTQAPILICGEGGTGKEIYAHAIHAYSDHGCEPFITVNCAATPSEALKQELFGQEISAQQSDATPNRTLGKLELCDGGTIFLDSIDQLSIEIQHLLLRLLTTKRLWRCDGKAELEVNIRIIAATHANLETLVSRNRFLSPLYEMLRQTVYSIPPLRKRPDDIALMAQQLISHLNETEHTQKFLPAASIALLKKRSWPGNGRELHNTVLSAFYFCKEAEISPEYIDIQKTAPTQSPFKDEWSGKEQAERQKLVDILLKYDANVEKAAAALHISRATLYRHLKKYNIRCKEISSSQ